MPDGCEKLTMDLPIAVIRAQVSNPIVDEMRRIAYDEIPLLGVRHIPQIVGMVSGDPSCELIFHDRSLTGLNGLRIDIGEAQRFGETVREQRKSDEPWTGAPFEYALLPGHVATFQEGDEILSEITTAAIEMFLKRDLRISISHVLPGVEFV